MARIAIGGFQHETSTVFRDGLRGGGEGPEMVVIPAGRFEMGAPDGEAGRRDNESPRHPVRIGSPFALGRTEMTVAVGEFARFVAATDYRTDAEKGDVIDEKSGAWAERAGSDWRVDAVGREALAALPVVHVSWNDAVAYLEWLSRETGQRYRLATEAEWEYAARADTTTARPWSDEASAACAHANVADRTAEERYPSWRWEVHECRDGYALPAPVGQFEASGFGLHDMLGNVWEWVQDCWHVGYAGAPDDGAAWEGSECGRRVLRGGAWNGQPLNARSAVRSRNDAGAGFNFVGFRLARTL